MPSCFCRSALSPSSTTLPTSSTYARAAASSATFAFCSTTSTASPSSALSSLTMRKITWTTVGASPSDGSSSMSSRGRDTNARASASICCSPPLSVPACWLRRASSHGKYPKTRLASVRIVLRSPRAYAPMRRLSHTLSSAKRPRPSGTCAMPARATVSARARESGFPSKTISPVCRTVPETDRSVVVLPAPFAPSSATISPSSTRSDTPCSALIGPYRASTPRSSSSGGIFSSEIRLDHLWVYPHVRRRAAGDQTPEVENVHVITDGHDEVHVVLDEQYGQVEVDAELANDADELRHFLVAESS